MLIFNLFYNFFLFLSVMLIFNLVSKSVILAVISSISFKYLSKFSLLFAIFSLATFISELICSCFWPTSKLRFCVSSIFTVISSISCFSFSDCSASYGEAIYIDYGSLNISNCTSNSSLCL